MANEIEIKVKVKDGEARAELKLFEEEAKREGEKAGSGFADKFKSHMANLGKGIGKGGGLFAGAGGLLSMAAPLGAAGVAMGAFGAIAIPVLSKVEQAHQKLTAAQQKYNQAVTNKQRIAALKAEQQATDGLSGSEKGLMAPISQLSNMWAKLQSQMAPLVVDVAKVALSLLTVLMPAFKLLASAGGNALETILGYIGQFARSPLFKQMAQQIAALTAAIAPLLGQTLVQLLTLLAQLFIQLGPVGVQLLNELLPLIILLVTDLVPVIAVISKVIAVVLQWLQSTHLLIPALILVGGVILATQAPLIALGIAIAVVIAGIVEFAKHWKQIWAEVKSIVADAVNWISHHWTLVIGILTGPVGLAIQWIVTHFSTITALPGRVVSAVAHVWGSIYDAIVSPVWDAVKTVFGYFNQILNFAASIPSKVGNFLGSLGSKALGLIGFEHGGVVGAAATGGVRSNMVMVGEHGRELVRLPSGSQVHSNPDTERMMGQGGGGGGHVTIAFDFGGSGSDELVRVLRKAIRVKGGNVQTVLGH